GDRFEVVHVVDVRPAADRDAEARLGFRDLALAVVVLEVEERHAFDAEDARPLGEPGVLEAPLGGRDLAPPREAGARRGRGPTPRPPRGSARGGGYDERGATIVLRERRGRRPYEPRQRTGGADGLEVARGLGESLTCVPVDRLRAHGRVW